MTLQIRLRILMATASVLALPSIVLAQTTGGKVAGQVSVRVGKVIVMAIADGKERNGDVASGSGNLVQSAIRDALVARGFAPFTSETGSIADAVKEAKDLAYDYVLRARITEWEDNATAWSGKKDSVALSIEIYDLTPTLLASGSHRQRGSSFAVTDSAPDRMLMEAVRAALGRAIGQAAKTNSPGR
jgi:hypothetical protein